MKKLAVLLAANENYDMALANVIIGLKRYNEKLIDNIVVFHDISEQTIEKLKQIWEEKLIFRLYTFEHFMEDIGGKDYFDTKRFSHLMYVKYYIFDLLREYENVIWLDSDVLVINNIERLICQEGVDCQARVANHGRFLIENTFKALNIPLNRRDFTYLKEGVISFSAKSLDKMTDICPTKECFRIALELYDKKIISNPSGSDGIPWNCLIVKYNLIYKALAGKGDTWQYEDSSKSCVIHMSGEQKPWRNSVELISFQEWYVNYKMWINNFKGVERLCLHKSVIPIENSNSLHNILKRLEVFCPLFEKLSFILARDFCLCQFFFETPIVSHDFKIIPYTLNKQIYYCVRLNALPWYAPALAGIVCEINLYNVCQIAMQKANINFKTIQEQKYFYLYFALDYRNIESMSIQLSQLIKNTYKSLLKEIKQKPIPSIYLVAKDRIYNHLAYKLGSAMILNSKSLLGYIRMPYVLSYIKAQHSFEQEKYQKAIAKNPSLKLPKLESYPDYQEALREKQCFTYKLGEALMQANSVRGGGEYLLTLPFSKKCVS